MFNAIFHWIFNNIFGITSFIISIYTLWKNRKHIDVNWSNNILKAEPTSVFVFKNQEKFFYTNAYLTKLSIVNSSPNDIAFFDLRAFNPYTNINLPLVTKKTFPYGQEDNQIFHSINGQLARLNVPKQNSGIFKANSFTQFDLIVCPSENLKNLDFINISFKIAKYNHFGYRNPFSTIRKNFKWFGISYSLATTNQSNNRNNKC